MTEEHTISIDFATHRTTGLMVATSPEMKGLFVHGRSEEEITERLPQAIKAILQADGHPVKDVRVTEIEAEAEPETDFVPSPRKMQVTAA